ncbi:MAG: hypothetical protein M0P31_19290 [Solirubrobacteraceae bacterium]|nr:hypothetical protein [Solirubrobacteraceae bacterium]
MTTTAQQTIDRILAGRTRSFDCSRCGATVETVRLVGRLPDRCEGCGPKQTAWKLERRERPLRDAIRHLARENQRLSAQAASTRPTLAVDVDHERARRHGPPGPEAVARALKRVRFAVGAHGTREALLDLAAAATAWADLLDDGGRRR